MADEKWISGLTGECRRHEAARLALGLRLSVVRDRLPAAVFHADDDIEHVHQLRVGTRRAAAALRIFASCLPERLHKKMRKSLRALRRSAGEARDWDVFLDMLQSRLAKAPQPQRRGLDFLLGFAHAQRVLAQEHLRQAFDANSDDFALRIGQVDQALDAADSGQTLSDLAFPMLTELLRELEAAAGGDLACYEALHRVRILGKQLRYAMEIFESCFTSELRPPLLPRHRRNARNPRPRKRQPHRLPTPGRIAIPAPPHPAEAMAALQGRDRDALAISRETLAAAAQEIRNLVAAMAEIGSRIRVRGLDPACAMTESWRAVPRRRPG